MNREKLIEEMARELAYNVAWDEDELQTVDCLETAKRLYNAGYRKQSEGEWVHDINNLYGCSNCLARETMSHKKLKPFCPICGAKMEGE